MIAESYFDRHTLAVPINYKFHPKLLHIAPSINIVDLSNFFPSVNILSKKQATEALLTRNVLSFLSLCKNTTLSNINICTRYIHVCFLISLET